MTRFWHETDQGDLFPNRTTVGREFVMELYPMPAAADGVTSVGEPAAAALQQPRLPLRRVQP